MINKFKGRIFGMMALLTVSAGCSALGSAVVPDSAVGAGPSITDQVKEGKRPLSDMVSSKDDDTILKKIPEPEGIVAEHGIMAARGSDELIKSELQRLMSAFGEDEEVPQVYFDEVRGWVRLFQANQQYKKFVTASLKQSAKYMPTLKDILSKKGIPEDMAYIAFIESGFNPRAVSPTGAMGMWQFIPGTARNYALKVGKNSDERLDPVRSTYAAAEYFHDLIAIFGPGSYLLAMAAYNSGEGKIISCLKGIENPFEQRNFWHIRPCLSKETREYPPKIIAASIIGNNPAAFGFPVFKNEDDDSVASVTTADFRSARDNTVVAVRRRIASNENVHELEKPQKEAGHRSIAYVVKKGNRLESIARVFGVEAHDIKTWNRLKTDKIVVGQHLSIRSGQPHELVTYKVRKGDTIRDISDAFNVRPSHLVTCNGLKNGLHLNEGQTLIVYMDNSRKPVIHLARKGISLVRIAEKYNVKVKDVMMWNNMTSTSVQAGHRIKIYAKQSRDI